ncbi:4-hydroxythreonine-4-phosphate dehydrogenase PdxA [Alienimonas sp. DA493]|uniref:4-hydroxythreonine-4-phosphate dehydrogenase PdxA n=1 Tax=Alienimonas sp. DA493 TaxID=3373605 RepID=UPI0037551E51
MARPRLLFTLGDAAGVGPEVAAGALCDARTAACCRPAVIGDPAVLRRALDLLPPNSRHADGPSGAKSNKEVRVEAANNPAGLFDGPPGVVRCFDPTGGLAREAPPGQVSGAAGKAAHDWLVAAADLCLAGAAEGIVTAPLNKAALAAGGVTHPGHTEILAERCGRPGEPAEVRMTLHLPPGPANLRDFPLGPDGLTVAHATLHTSIASVPGLLTVDRVAGTGRLLDEFLTRIAASRRRIGVCALNPHGGEGGLFGGEEEETIAPAVERLRAEGRDVHGPIPADTLFRQAAAGAFDAVAAIYHDQGHIALRLIGWGRAVNVTLGLPIVRTSPSHGTAFDIAWTGEADPEGMIGAVQVAAKLATVEGSMTKAQETH